MEKRRFGSNMKRLGWLVDFLEEDLTIRSLKSDPQMTLELGIGIRDIILQDEEVRRWDKDFFSKEKMKKYKQLIENPSDIEMAELAIGGLAKNVYAFYKDLKIIWVEFKKSLNFYRDGQIPSLTYGYFSIKIESRVDLRSDKIKLSTGNAYVGSGLDEIPIMSIKTAMHFLSLFEGLSFDRFRQCKDCDRWFVSTYHGKGKKKEACGNKCASRSNQWDLRNNKEREDEYEKVKRKQQARYYKKTAGYVPPHLKAYI